MSITCITSFNQPYWDLIGKDCVESFIKYWPTSIQLTCYVEDMELPNNSRFSVVPYCDFDYRYTEVQEKLANKSQQKFAKKGWSVIHAMETIKTDWLIWLDADVITQKPIPEKFFTSMLQNQYLSVYLGVKYDSDKQGNPGDWLVPETGFFAINLKHKNFDILYNEYMLRYVNQNFADLRRGYDNDVFGAALLKANSLNYDLCANLKKPYKTPMKHTILGEYLQHWKAKHSKKDYNLQ